MITDVIVTDDSRKGHKYLKENNLDHTKTIIVTERDRLLGLCDVRFHLVGIISERLQDEIMIQISNGNGICVYKSSNGFALAPVKQEGGWFLPLEPELQDFLNSGSNSQLRQDIIQVIKRLEANQKKKPGCKVSGF